MVTYRVGNIAGDGFKLFRLFGDKSGKEDVKVEQAPNVKKNWFSNMFKPNKQETVFEQGTFFFLLSFL